MMQGAQQTKSSAKKEDLQAACEQVQTHLTEASAQEVPMKEKMQNYEEAQRQLNQICTTLQQDISLLDSEISNLGKNLGKKLNWIYDYEASTILPALKEDQGQISEETKSHLNEICTNLKQSVCQLDVDIARMNKNICEKMKWIFEYESDTLLPTLQAGKEQITEEIGKQLEESRTAMQQDFMRASDDLKKTVQEIESKYETALHAVESAQEQQAKQNKKMQVMMALCGVNVIGIAAVLMMLFLH